MVDRHLLNIALATIHEDESGRPFRSGLFDKLLVDLHVSYIQEEDKYKDIFFLFELVHRDVWTLETIIQRTAWQKWMVSSGGLSDEVGALYAACDVNLFHVQYRSLFDRLAKIIGLLSGRPNTMPPSFRKLRDWVGKPENEPRIDGQLAQFITSCHWFGDLRRIRDSIVHSHGRTIIRLQDNKFLFQVHGLKHSVPLPKVLFHENSVDFELYSSLFMGYLLAYLESLAAITRQKLNLREYPGESRVNSGGLRFLRVWIQRLCEDPDTI
jgi:hypothetical protein